jgi:hypothetical protein
MPAQQQANTQAELSPAQQIASPPQNYAVGRGNPPRETQFKPGQSGNPTGRPKGRSLKDVFQKIAAQSLDEGYVEYGNIDPKLSKIDGALLALFRQSRRGDVKALKHVLDLYREFSSADEEEASDELEAEIATSADADSNAD